MERSRGFWRHILMPLSLKYVEKQGWLFCHWTNCHILPGSPQSGFASNNTPVHDDVIEIAFGKCRFLKTLCLAIEIIVRERLK